MFSKINEFAESKGLARFYKTSQSFDGAPVRLQSGQAGPVSSLRDTMRIPRISPSVMGFILRYGDTDSFEILSVNKM